MKAVGARLPRYDGVAHVTGRSQFVDDVRVPNMLWAKALRSPVHHAGITKLDTKKAEAIKGVQAVVTWEDVPRLVYGHLEAMRLAVAAHDQRLVRWYEGLGFSIVEEQLPNLRMVWYPPPAGEE